MNGKKQGDIWHYVNQGVSLGRGHYKASCKYCSVSWERVEPLPEARVESLNKAILKAWVMCNFSFETLSGHFLDQEVLRIDNDLEKKEFLTLYEITNNDRTNNLDDINESEILESLILNIADSVDLMLPEFLASGDAIFSSEPVRARNVAVGNMNYNPIELARQMVLQDEEN
ncbi:13764_t:CDS:2 [Dentiscutata erythropus]|uniref:13764_t:CDS:1 n=1 Tax=Dentiscutata erythropus TaxID=1348616 RepID=A0A9N9NW29_9GLOM|nr:13764_t:CDS:2 [Dentiscutata erythropus]